MISPEELVARVEKAFAVCVYPGDASLVDYECDDSEGVVPFLRGRHWRELTPDEMVENYASLFFMTPEALKFFLPAFLVASVLHYDDVDQVPGTLISLLRLPGPDDQEANARFETRFGALTADQRAAIADVLGFLSDTHGADFPQADGGNDAAIVRDAWRDARKP